LTIQKSILFNPKGELKVALLTPTATATQLLRVVTADVTVIGQVVDQNGLVVTPGPDGHVIPTYLDKDGIHWRQFANGAPIINGAFTLKLSSAEASHFRLHASFPNLQGYTEIFAPRLDLVQGTTRYNVTLPIALDNSKISGPWWTRAAPPRPVWRLPSTAPVTAGPLPGAGSTRWTPATRSMWRLPT
jgi:hypothetical protein